MELNRRFRLGPQERIALVGSGGKTTLMFQLAKDFGSPVICTTTTHLALDQLTQADRHLVASDVSELPDPNQSPLEELLLVTGPEVEPNRVGSPPADVLEALVELAEKWACPLIIEADGARKLPLKAPAEHEPPIPDFIDVVITVVGLSGLGKPLQQEWVHRPELYSRLVGIPMGEILESQHLVNELTSPQGGLKNIPENARKILLINQVDAFPNWKTFYQHMDVLLDSYQAVGFSVLEDEMLLEVHEKIAGVVLAAGGATRFGEPKQLLDWFGQPLVSNAVDIARAGGLSPVLVVTGADHDSVSEVLRNTPAEVVCNAGWAEGQSSSIQVGVKALPETVGGAVFLLVDQPLIPPELIKKLVQEHTRHPAAITAPKIADRAGNPVLFDRDMFEALINLGGDIGGKALFDTYPPRYIEWDEIKTQQDIDTPDDYQRLRFSD
jgi:molybdenum cofactor cytidylyltransferase